MFKKNSKVTTKSAENDNYSCSLLREQGGAVNGPVAQDQIQILKSGYAKKFKTMKRKFFVLQAAHENQDAQLQYYDSEKKWQNGSQPKRIIILKDCFVIKRYMDVKYQGLLSLYTMDDCFVMMFDKESVMEDWLQLLVNLHKSNQPLDSKPLPCFDYIWQVIIKNKGLGSNKKLIGQHRVCLSDRALYLIKMGIVNPAEMEFPLSSIRRCGHSDTLFFMELGRSACIGAGELWMQVEDTLMAQNMHETILGAMKSSGSTEDSTSGTKPRSRRSTSSFSYNSESTLSSFRSGYSSAPYRNESFLDNPSVGAFRQRTVSEGQHSLSKERNRKFERFSSHVDRSQSASQKALSFSDEYFPKAQSLTGSPATDGPLHEDDLNESSISLHGMSSLHKSAAPTICEESESVEDYLSMDPSSQSQQCDEYLDMEPTEAARAEESLAEMSVDAPNKPTSLNLTNQINNSAKSSDDPYMQMSSPACSPVQSNLNNMDGYLYMSSGVNIKSPSPSSSLTSSMLSNDGYMSMSGKSPSDLPSCQYHLDKVQSYISDLTEFDEFPMRSYSVGAAAKSNLLIDQKHRTRAFSCGSHDDAAKNKLAASKTKNISRINSEEHDQKSISAPHLPEQKSQTYGGSRQEDLMELEFRPNSVSSTCSQSSSIGSINSRSRSGSKSSTSRFKSAGSKYRSCDADPTMNQLSPEDQVDGGAKGVNPRHVAEKLTPKMSPSQELVQQLFTKVYDIKPIIDDDVDNSGDYINIDLQYNRDSVQLQSPVVPATTPAKTHDYMNLDFQNKPEAAVKSEARTNQMIKQQSAPAVVPPLPQTVSKSPIRKTSCPVAITETKEAVPERKYSLEPPFTYENITFSSQHKSPFSSRPSSVCSELELNYASLDLAPASEEDASRSSPRPIPSQTSSTNNVSMPLDEPESSLGLSYAKIDFTRSEGLRATANSVIENKH